MPPSMIFADKTYMVFGLGKTGQAVIALLGQYGAVAYAWDDHMPHRDGCEAAYPECRLLPIDDVPWQQIDGLILSPGVPLTHPEPHPIVAYAKQAHCPIICDVELLYQLRPESRYIGITGTNGKSTTSSLMQHILQSCDRSSALGGNIGIAAASLAQQSAVDHCVLELSSYQLDLLQETRCHIAIWLNISPDHLERHGDIDGYIQAKQRLFRHQTADDYAIINVDDPYSNAVFHHLQASGHPANVIPFSTQSCEALHHIKLYCIGDVIVDRMDGSDHERHITLPELPHLRGVHNRQNFLAVYAAARALGLAANDIITAAQHFAGLKHRMQHVAQTPSMRFINDSKATNADACQHALTSFDAPIHWIVGGVAKAGGIESLKPHFAQVTHAYLIGESTDHFAEMLEGILPYSKCYDLETAFHAAKRETGVMVFSPACASFDQFANFEARGDAFIELVMEEVGEV